MRGIPPLRLTGRIAGLSGLMAEVAGLSGQLAVGSRLLLHPREAAADARGTGVGPGQAGAHRASPILAEVVGFRGTLARTMAFGALDGLGPGAASLMPVRRHAGGFALGEGGMLAPSDAWLGRVIDPLGRPLDGGGPLPQGPISRPVRAAPLPAAERARLGPRIDLGVRALDCFATSRQGQRLGLFAGSGVGKSTLLAMLARGAATDVTVLALVGERGREVREFIEDELGPEGLARAVIVVATSDAPPLLRREAAHAAMTVAEHFRDQGRQVLLMMDSVTRFCLALREIGLSAGEPPATRGYPPSVFAELPRLLERAGPGLQPPQGDARSPGHITALFTVLVEGDDHNEPVADAVRGILDGHVVLDRRIAEAGRYPAIDVLRSLSRAASGCLAPAEAALVRRARALLALYADMADLVRLGAYRAGADPAVDEAVTLAPRIEAVLAQDRATASTIEDGFAALRAALETNVP
ncbi:MAG: flagellar protein export ATPase FliI [Proteobacteria bacterium]|nr:flagellar protein export ATPase FliI [Pseudomonadota bacterium]